MGAAAAAATTTAAGAGSVTTTAGMAPLTKTATAIGGAAASTATAAVAGPAATTFTAAAIANGIPIASVSSVTTVEAAMEREVPLLKREHFMSCSSADYSGIATKVNNSGDSGSKGGKEGVKVSFAGKDLKPPIIIIPDIPSYPLSVTNVRTFLEDGIWRPATRKDPKVTSVLISLRAPPAGSKRKISGKFMVVDSVGTIEKDEWHRVIAAFVIGQPWQFKSWAWKTPIDVTHNIQTFAVSVDKSPLKPTISQWKIPILSVTHTQHAHAILYKLFF